MDDPITKAIHDRSRDGSLTCLEAHALAQQFGVSPGQIGRTVSAGATTRFTRCQLGLFGYGPKSEGKSKILLRATNLPEEVVSALRSATTDGKVPCALAWEIARAYEYPRLGIANIIEALGLKVSPCQLGCF